ncbi:hypothetical protein I6E74_10150 [Salinibacterium sp. SWN139]|uniref:hypothetical protein n=1 Tax=Salinibacterium sp. SWN139 TaxID=2792055 RepID=UPI0018CFAF93|nr:hypothetical protein [Salinibacterium sp. SWN139]MBH0054526.1 hypothetical protein [Salinibacterium sp. SWN139]
MTSFSSPSSRFARWAAAAYLSAGLLGANQLLWGFYGLGAPAVLDFPVAVTVIGAAVGAFAIALLIFGIVMTWFSIRARAATAQPAEPPHETATHVNETTTHEVLGNTTLDFRTRLLIGVATVVAMIAIVAIGIVNIYVWNPLAKVPELSLDEIYAAMDAAGELQADVFSWIWAIFWPLAAVVFTAITTSRIFANIVTLRGMLVASLALLSAAIFFQWFAGFSMGMGLADTFAIGGGDASSPGMLLGIFGQFCIVAALFLAITPKRTNAGRLPEQTTRVVTN